MSLHISLEGNLGPDAPADLQELAELLADERIAATASTLKVPGAKADLTIGLSIASFGVSAVGTLFQVISFWQDRKKQYRLTLETTEKTIAMADAKAPEILARAADAKQPVRILVEQS